MEAFEKVSVIVSMVLYVSERGSLTMKSIATDVNGVVYFSDDKGKGVVLLCLIDSFGTGKWCILE